MFVVKKRQLTIELLPYTGVLTFSGLGLYHPGIRH